MYPCNIYNTTTAFWLCFTQYLVTEPTKYLVIAFLLDFVSNVKAASSSAACLQMVSPISEVELPRTLLMCSTTFTFTLFKRGCTTSCRNFLASASCNQIQGNRLSARTNTLQRKQYQTTSARNTEECNKCFAPRFAVTTLIAGRLIDQAYAGQRYKSSFNTVKAQWNSTEN